jgi:hypothetical protein
MSMIRRILRPLVPISVALGLAACGGGGHGGHRADFRDVAGAREAPALGC